MVRPANDNRREGPTLGAWVLISVAATAGLTGPLWSMWSGG